MLALWIILGIVLINCLLLSARAVLVLEADSECRLTLRFLFIRIRLYPTRTTPKQQLRIMRKKAKKQKKENGRRKKRKPVRHTRRNRKPSDILHTVKLVTRILQRIYRKFPAYFRLKLTRVKLLVGGEDAAQVAIRYGAVRAALAYLLTALEVFMTIKTTRKSDLTVEPNFLSSASSCDIHITLSTSLRSLVALVIRALVAYLRERRHLKKHPNTTPKTDIRPTVQ